MTTITAMNTVFSGVSHWSGWLAQGAGAPLAQGASPAPSADAAGSLTGGVGQGGSQGGGMLQLALFAGIFVVFYLLVLRPQQKRAKAHKAFLEALQIGSSVVTTGGLFGKVVALEGAEAKVEIAKGVTIRILKSQVAGLETNAAQAVADLSAR